MQKKRPQLAKLTRPRLHRAVIRERLFALLDEKREHPVIWIVGPPGAGTRCRTASTVISNSSDVPSEKCGADTVASAISFFSTGDHVVVVARPIWWPSL